MKKIVIAGGTGFLGRFLSSRFREDGAAVIVVARKNGDVVWTDHDALVSAVEDADLVVNLAGRSVDCRYNEKNKKEILDSRLETTAMLGNAIAACQKPPALWINSSTATIYRHAEDRPMTEENGEIGKGFSVNVATQWENRFFSYHLSHTRQVAMRMAIVLGKTGGALKPLKIMTRLGLGGKQGKGNQMFSWVHIEDVYQVILFLMEHDELTGAVNCSSPFPLPNKEVMKLLREKLGVPVGIPSPAWLLEIGAVFIRTETELLLKSRWVLPGRLLKAGYRFKYPDLDSAFDESFTKIV